MSQPLSPKRLSFESLEDRTTPAWGVPWFDGSSLTLSFVPDGTDISGKPSNLAGYLGTTMSGATWKKEVLRAYQTWVVEANLNVGVVTDWGSPMGVAGPPQEDIRFGDIRIGARHLSEVGAQNANMAGAVGFDYDAKTWAGDLVFNSRFPFGVGNVPGAQYDLYTVALHEAGHSFGIADQNTDPTSVMWARYEGARTTLSPADVAALRAMYGARADDGYEGAGGNGSTATAYNLTANGNLTAVSADVTRVADVDYYKFTTPSGSTGVTGLTVNLQAAGVSLLTARVTVLDAAGNTVASVVTTDPLSNNLAVAVPNYQPSATYFVKVEGAGTDVFSVGAYVLKLNYSPTNPAGTTSAVTNSYYTNFEWAANDTHSSAPTLTPVRSTKSNTFYLAGMISNPNDADWYKITPTATPAFTGTLFVGTVTSTNGLLPSIAVYDAAGNALPAVVAMNENGSYQVQLANAATGTTYFVRVTAADPAGGRSTGVYTLGATLAPVAATQFGALGASTLSTASATKYSQMTVEGDRLMQFALTATGGSATAMTAVRMTLFDATGKAVFTTVAVAGRPLSTGAVWLASGTYTVVFNAATQNGSAIGALALDLAARQLSDPIDPYVEDPGAPPPEEPPIVIGIIDPNPPPGPPIIDPITDPFYRLFSNW